MNQTFIKTCNSHTKESEVLVKLGGQVPLTIDDVQ